MKTNLTFNDITSLPETVPAIVEKLEALKARVSNLQKTLPRGAAGTQVTLESARRDTLKTKLLLDGYEAKYQEDLGLDMVESKLHDQLLEVGDARKDAGLLYFECSTLLNVIKPALKAMRGKVTGSTLETLESLQDEIKALLKEVEDSVVKQLPELGMTFSEWNSMTPKERSSMRSSGRPTAPLEAKMIEAHRDLLDCVTLVSSLSSGEMRSVDEAIEGVELSKRGRPPVSELGKASRELMHLQKRLKEVIATPSRLQEKKIARLKASIKALRKEIKVAQAEMTPLEAAKRELEVLRAEHRDMVVEEVSATGEDQSALLMAIIRNEDKQLTCVGNILKIDPTDNVTVTSKVNPKDTRQRFERLRMNGQIKAAELAELSRMEDRQSRFAYSRNR